MNLIVIFFTLAACLWLVFFTAAFAYMWFCHRIQLQIYGISFTGVAITSLSVIWLITVWIGYA